MKDFENSLDTMLEKAFLTISNGVNDAKSYFHTPTVCTFEGQDISARTVVLRDFNKQERVLRFHTDQRSPKISQIKENNKATVHAYDQGEKIQIRLKGNIEVHHQDSITKKAWENTREMSKECYSVADAPGLSIDDPNAFDIDAKNLDLELGYANFCVVLFQFDSLEFLHLKGSGHRRAKHVWLNNYLSSSWLIP